MRDKQFSDPNATTQPIFHSSIHEYHALEQADHLHGSSKVFGRRHLFFWLVPIIEVNPTGFMYKGNPYRWADVKSVTEVNLFLSFDKRSKYRARINLVDGARIEMDCRFVEEIGKKPKVGFWSTRTDAYEELLALMQRAL